MKYTRSGSGYDPETLADESKNEMQIKRMFKQGYTIIEVFIEYLISSILIRSQIFLSSLHTQKIHHYIIENNFLFF